MTAVAFAPLTAGPTDSAFIVELTSFSGPLDLLMALLREEQVDIYDIPIARIAEQFLARIRTLGLNEAADYLEMAARLLRIKAQMLMPRGEAEAWEDPRAELVRRLLEYQQIREVVDVLERRGEERRNQFARTYVQGDAGQPAVPPPLALSLSDLLAAVDRVLRAVREPRMHDVIARALDVPGAIGVLRALLELAKLGELRVSQRSPFADVEITRDAASEVA
jgi:segregation and condensation protein A